jgi:hypothetical protein
MNYARPTSSAFDPQRRTPSFASSQQRLSVAPIPPPRHYQTSINTNTERDSIPPSIVAVPDTPSADVRNNEANADPIFAADANPFSDPPELANFTPVAEKEVAPWPVEPTAEPTQRRKWTGKKLCFVLVPIVLLILIIVLVPVGLLVLKPKNNSQTQSSTTNSSNTDGLTSPDNRDPSSLGIPQSALGTVLDSTKWLDWTDFNITYTSATVGGLSLMVRQLSHLN